MFERLKNILCLICIVMLFTAQTKRPDDKGQQHAPGARPASAARPAPGARPVAAVHNNQPRPQAQTRRAAPQQQVQRAQLPRVNVPIPQPFDERRAASPRVYAVPAPAPVKNNRLFNRQHHKHWQPLYNFYDNQYHFYPYVNVTSPVELSTDYATILFNGQTYYYDQGSFYVQDPQGYLAAPPPIGIIVPVLPQNARQINVNDQVLYRYKGVFYVQVAQGYQVVGPVQPAPSGDS